MSHIDDIPEKPQSNFSMNHPNERSYLKNGISAETISRVINFRDARSWSQFHNSKDLAISISLEASELLEVFQWSGPNTDLPDKLPSIREELADVINYCILMADALGLSLDEILNDKVDRNEKKYNIENSFGNSKKYTEWEEK